MLAGSYEKGIADLFISKCECWQQFDQSDDKRRGRIIRPRFHVLVLISPMRGSVGFVGGGDAG